MLLSSLVIFVLLTTKSAVQGFSVAPHRAAASTTAASRMQAHDDDDHDNNKGFIENRRSVLASCAAFAAAALGSIRVPVWAVAETEASSVVDYKAVAADIASLIQQDPDKGPTLVSTLYSTRMREEER